MKSCRGCIVNRDTYRDWPLKGIVSIDGIVHVFHQFLNSIFFFNDQTSFFIQYYLLSSQRYIISEYFAQIKGSVG